MGAVLSYQEALKQAMTSLGEDPKVILVGQGMEYDSNRLWDSVQGVPASQRLEFPVAEDFQLGFCMGLAMEGYLPVAVYPRWDFLLLAANQLVNHLDKLPAFGWPGQVLVRVAVGATQPLDPGPQHTQDHSRAFTYLLRTIPVYQLYTPEAVTSFWAMAHRRRESAILVEYPR